MKYLWIVLAFTSFFFSCSSFWYSGPNYVKIAHKITNKTAKKLKEEKNLYLIGTGGKMMHDIQEMDMSFQFYQVVDIGTARQLLVDATQAYLLAINSSKEIRPYLHTYPFTVENVEIAIYFYNPDGSTVSTNEIEVGAIRQGKAVYYIDYPEKHTIKSIHEETYEEALQIVNAEKELSAS